MSGTQPPPPRRVAVTAPRRDRTGGWSARAVAEDLHAQPRLGQVYVRSLVRDQLRLSLGVLAVLAVVIGGLPAAFALAPGLRTVDVLGVRLAWLLLGVVAYPLLVGAAWFHVRHAERVERDFTDLLNAPDTPPGSAPAPAAPTDTAFDPAAQAAPTAPDPAPAAPTPTAPDPATGPAPSAPGPEAG
ncbi:hypothetical protein ACFZAM_14210 [Streptomyces sp. NPDC008079]|uniref:hypothetical protein n=1 Tax=Streptomyces sp. NPDC008079 TaxID=3364806 RepID=UPI0036E8F08D